ncbi:hypothetical protein [Algoriphagus sp. PAP.12]|uniref:hypothetical protein n=1 Tax=Algoriphagus sp. PAP.12 TaxID=2996678 RepID=UPI00227C5E37|nr:hypothetical protein [Algoriphagus sp. PAP.12]
MFLFFKKIKKKLIAENRIKNYLVYALGEIVLVVLGILIALWINNSSQYYQLRKKEQTYLMGLEKEFLITQQKLDTLIKINQKNIQGAQEIIQAMDQRPINISERKFSNLLYQALAFDISLNSNNSLLTEIINSGSLKDITNQELKQSLTTWMATLEDIKQQERDQEDQRQTLLDFFKSDQYSLKTILNEVGVLESNQERSPGENRNNMDLLNSVAFENALLLFIFSAEGTDQSHYLPLKEDIEKILMLIRQEIKE